MSYSEVEPAGLGFPHQESQTWLEDAGQDGEHPGLCWRSSEIDNVYDDFYPLGFLPRVYGVTFQCPQHELQSDWSLRWSSGVCIDLKHAGPSEGFKAELGSTPHTFLMSFTQQLEKRTDPWKAACRIINFMKLIYLKIWFPNQNLRFHMEEITSDLFCSVSLA